MPLVGFRLSLGFHRGNTDNHYVVLAQYIFRMTDREGTDWELKGIAVGGYTLAVIRKWFSVSE